MILGGFPSVTGYTLLTAAAYLLVRVMAEHRRAYAGHLVALAAAGAGVAAGVGLTAFQLVPWTGSCRRSSSRAAHRTRPAYPVRPCMTAVAPFAFGTANPAQPPTWFGGLEIIAAESYVGAAALMLVSLRWPWPARPVGAAARRLVVAAQRVGLWITVSTSAARCSRLLQHTGFLFSDNFVGRARSVLGFLDRGARRGRFRGHPAQGSRRRRRRTWDRTRPSAGPGVVRPRDLGVFPGAALWVYFAARRLAGPRTPGRGPRRPDLGPTSRSGGDGRVVMLVSGAIIAWLWFAPPPPDRPSPPGATARRRAALCDPGRRPGTGLGGELLPTHRSGELLPDHPHPGVSRANLGHDRYYGADGAIYGSVDIAARLRSLHGHGFIEAVSPSWWRPCPASSSPTPRPPSSARPPVVSLPTSPVLDRAAVATTSSRPTYSPSATVQAEQTLGFPLPVRSGETLRRASLSPDRCVASGSRRLTGDARRPMRGSRSPCETRHGAIISRGSRTGKDIQVGLPGSSRSRRSRSSPARR